MRDLISELLGQFVGVAREIDRTLITGSVENARLAVKTNELRREMAVAVGLERGPLTDTYPAASEAS